MIRAHLATFPPRRAILSETVRSLAPQVDRLCICLNEYDAVPSELAAFDNVEMLIPDTDLKDAGKFAFNPGPDDIVFTCDDDIIYPTDYVAHTIAQLGALGDDASAIGYHAHAFVFKKQKQQHGWRNYMFHRAVRNTFKVDILGTGTACFRGAIAPDLAACISAAGFVDQRFSRIMTNSGKPMWTIPRADKYIINNMPPELDETSLFRQVNRRNAIAVRRETQLLLRERGEGSGLPYKRLKRDGVV